MDELERYYQDRDLYVLRLDVSRLEGEIKLAQNPTGSVHHRHGFDEHPCGAAVDSLHLAVASVNLERMKNGLPAKLEPRKKLSTLAPRTTMKIQEEVRQILLAQELSNTEKRDRLRALIPADVCKIDDVNQATPAQLKQLRGAIEAALALQQLDAEEFEKEQYVR